MRKNNPTINICLQRTRLRKYTSIPISNNLSLTCLRQINMKKTKLFFRRNFNTKFLKHPTPLVANMHFNFRSSNHSLHCKLMAVRKCGALHLTNKKKNEEKTKCESFFIKILQFAPLETLELFGFSIRKKRKKWSIRGSRSER